MPWLPPVTRIRRGCIPSIIRRGGIIFPGLELFLYRLSIWGLALTALMIAVFFLVLSRSNPRAEMRWWTAAWFANVAAVTITLIFWLAQPPAEPASNRVRGVSRREERVRVAARSRRARVPVVAAARARSAPRHPDHRGVLDSRGAARDDARSTGPDLAGDRRGGAGLGRVVAGARSHAGGAVDCDRAWAAGRCSAWPRPRPTAST